MNVTFLKDHQMGSNSFIKDQTAVIITSLAEQLVKDGVCEENNSVTLREKIVEATSESAKDDILDGLPDHAEDIVDNIPSISNKKVLEELATDDRSTVSKAAKKRLKQLN